VPRSDKLCTTHGESSDHHNHQHWKPRQCFFTQRIARGHQCQLSVSLLQVLALAHLLFLEIDRCKDPNISVFISTRAKPASLVASGSFKYKIGQIVLAR